jgi:hypothetical protein
MSVRFPASLIVIDGLWTAFKVQVAARGLNSVVQYDDDEDIYTIWAIEGDLCFNCQIYKGTVPTGNYTQGQNDSDKTDFETNFKPYANRSVDDTPSFIIANSIKSGGSANLGVNGAVTPVVFEYNPPATHDIEVNALTLLFEDVTAFAFGNNFIRNGLGTLANGLLLEIKAADAVVSPWQNMKRTRDLIEICDDFDIVTGTTNFMRAKIHLPSSLRLSRAGTFGTADYIRLTVRDDLSTIDFGEAHFQGTKL